MILDIGRGRIHINHVREQASVTVDIDGTGVTLFLSGDQAMQVTTELFHIVRKIRRRVG